MAIISKESWHYWHISFRNFNAGKKNIKKTNLAKQIFGKGECNCWTDGKFVRYKPALSAAFPVFA
jgi:hypothetical protein